MAHAAPSIAITSPAAGDTISRAATPEVAVTGTAAFPDAPALAQDTWYLRRNSCGAADVTSLSRTAGSNEAGDGCGNLLGVVGGGGDTYTATDGLPVTLGGGKVTGKVSVGGFLSGLGVTSGAAGPATVTVTVMGSTANGDSYTLATATQNFVVTPAQEYYVTEINADLPSDAVGATLTDLSLTTEYSNGNVLFGFTHVDGASLVTLPTQDTGTVQVSTSATFGATSTVTATLLEDGTWEAAVPTPAAGSRRIYARAVQNGVRVNATSVPITVTN